MPVTRRACAAVLAALAAGCESSSSIVARVGTDETDRASIPTLVVRTCADTSAGPALDHVPSEPTRWRPWGASGALRLPTELLRLGLLRSTAEGRGVWFEVFGLDLSDPRCADAIDEVETRCAAASGGACCPYTRHQQVLRDRACSFLSQRAQVRFVPGGVARVDVPLYRACRNVRCDDPDRRCNALGACVPIDDPDPDPDASRADVDASDATVADATRADVTTRDSAAADGPASEVAPDGSCGACAFGQTCVMGTCRAPATQRSCDVAVAGCGLVEVEGGTFTLGAEECVPGMETPTCGYNASPPRAGVAVGAFALDAYEVTVARFNAFWDERARVLDALRATPIAYPGGQSIAWGDGAYAEPVRRDALCNWLPSTDPAVAARAAHPMNCVDAWTAQAFCVWDGGRLPTEAEWAYAAVGRAVDGLTPGRVFPWGDTPPSASCDRAHWHDCAGEDGGGTRRVGGFAGSGGVFDLVGNVREFVADAYDTLGACWRSSVNPLCALGPSGERVHLGGSFRYDGDIEIRPAVRLFSSPNARGAAYGFRCARTRP